MAYDQACIHMTTPLALRWTGSVRRKLSYLIVLIMTDRNSYYVWEGKISVQLRSTLAVNLSLIRFNCPL